MLHARIEDARQQLATCKNCDAVSQDVLEGFPCPHCPTCESCDVVLTAENEQDDPQARFWMGDKRDRYCIGCADRLSEAQTDATFNLRYAS